MRYNLHTATQLNTVDQPQPSTAALGLVLAMQSKQEVTIFARDFLPSTGTIRCLETEDGSGFCWIVTLDNSRRIFIDLRRDPPPIIHN